MRAASPAERVVRGVIQGLGGSRIVSLSLVGSAARGLDARDVDVVAVIEGEADWRLVERVWRGVSASCGHCKVYVSLDTYDPCVKGPGVAYVMLYGESVYESASPLLRRTWSLYGSTVWGSSLREAFGVPRVGARDALEARFGVRWCSEALRRGYFTSSTIYDGVGAPSRRLDVLEAGLEAKLAVYCVRWSVYNALAALGVEADPYDVEALEAAAEGFFGPGFRPFRSLARGEALRVLEALEGFLASKG